MKYELQLKRRLVIYRILIAILLISIFLIGALSDRGILLDSRYMSMTAQQISRLIVFGGIIILLILHHRTARLLQNKVERNEKHIKENDERQIHSTPEEKLVSVACSRNAEMYEIAYRQAVKDYEKAQKQVNALEEEAVKALTGESQLDLKVVNAMLLKHREKLEAAQREMEETRNRVEQEDQNKKATKAQVDELRTWGEIYDGAKDEIRHMIIARLVERIDVEEGNKITIKYKVSFEQFMSADQASA